MEVFGNEIFYVLVLNIIQRYNFFQSFASIGRVDLVSLITRHACRFCSDDTDNDEEPPACCCVDVAPSSSG